MDNLYESHIKQFYQKVEENIDVNVQTYKLKLMPLSENWPLKKKS